MSASACTGSNYYARGHGELFLCVFFLTKIYSFSTTRHCMHAWMDTFHCVMQKQIIAAKKEEEKKSLADGDLTPQEQGMSACPFICMMEKGLCHCHATDQAPFLPCGMQMQAPCSIATWSCSPLSICH